jgi:glycosyltransferase involved in cell wall biosynthesis
MSVVSTAHLDATLSIVIPARNAARTIGVVLGDLAEMDLTDVEVLVVDDGSEDGTPAVAGEWADRIPRLRVVDGPGRGPAAARNCGATMATGSWVAFIDADVRLPGDWLRRGLARIGTDVAVIEGLVRPAGGTDEGLVRHSATSHGNGVFVSANLWVRRDAFERVGGFDERYVAPWREDTDLGWRLAAIGEASATAPELVVLHPYYRRSVASLFGDAKRIRADTRLRRKFPEQSRSLQPRRRMRRTYLATAALLAAVPAGVRRPVAGMGLVAAGTAWSVAAALWLVRDRGPAELSEWAQLVVTAPALALWRTYWVARSNFEERVWFW